MKLNYSLAFALVMAVFASCDQNRPTDPKENKRPAAQEMPKDEIPQKPELHYTFAYKKVWKNADSFPPGAHKDILAAVNRVDIKHLQRLDSFIVPDDLNREVAEYMHFPEFSASLKDIRKIILFSYPTQTFAAYENGKRVISGPTNMGKKASKTPLGLFFCNWKAKETRSTVDNEWILKWNFNVSNFGGVGFHQYDLPGYPASHSCMRLWAEQAEFLYTWAEQWKLQNGVEVQKGTPVIIFGEYPFGSPRPWFALVQNGKALDISEDALAAVVNPFKDKIMSAASARIAEDTSGSHAEMQP